MRLKPIEMKENIKTIQQQHGENSIAYKFVMFKYRSSQVVGIVSNKNIEGPKCMLFFFDSFGLLPRNRLCCMVICSLRR